MIALFHKIKAEIETKTPRQRIDKEFIVLNLMGGAVIYSQIKNGKRKMSPKMNVANWKANILNFSGFRFNNIL
ncbi:hypothetical protein SCALIN_C17_0204 [Candidatus Scalindua japonica]|uniref:Uncharacterized protein n=1 Tax=Candidatus Scalindua japonica TaxID=1284222 RepID=A0A286TZ67_9BACT|nr:hypothetical protein SCALIN_C17_0204 [Candidatus Scalindua japonica]